MAKARRKERERVMAVKRKVRWMERGSLGCRAAVPLARGGRAIISIFRDLYYRLQ